MRAARAATGRADPGPGRAGASAATRCRSSRGCAGSTRANRIEREYDDKTDTWIVKRNGYASSIFTQQRRDDDASRCRSRGGAKAFEVVGIPLAAGRLLRRRAREPEARRGAARRAEAVLRARGDARHQPRRALQARPRVVARVGDAAQRRARRSPTPRSTVRDCSGKTYWRGPDRRVGHRCASNARCPSATTLPSCGTRGEPEGILRHRAHGRRLRVRVLQLGRGHRAVALQRADRQLAAARTSRTPCSTARWCAPARRCR